MSLEIRDISKSYGGFRALDGVRLTVETGRLFGIIGPNGAGKSTLFSVLSGFARADEGQIRLDGRAIDSLSPPARARAGMVRTFQVPREFRHLTVRENLMAAAPEQTGESLFGLFFRPGRVRQEEGAIAERVNQTIRFLKLRAGGGSALRQAIGRTEEAAGTRPGADGRAAPDPAGRALRRREPGADRRNHGTDRRTQHARNWLCHHRARP